MFYGSVRLLARWMIGAAWLSGCSLAVNADRVQCSTDADCTKRGPAFAGSVCVQSICQAGPSSNDGTPDASVRMDASTEAEVAENALWGCLDKPRVTSPDPGPFHFTFHVTGILDGMPVAGASAKVCKKLDPDCTLPVAGPSAADSNGDVTFDIDKSFTGYVSFEKAGEMIPGLYFFNPPPDQDQDSVAIQAVTPKLLGTLAGLVHKLDDGGSPQEPGNGLTLINVTDCNMNAAVGVSFVAEGLPPRALPYYSLGGVPSGAATETDSAGYGGFINLPPGTFAVKGKVNGTNRELQTISVLIRAGSITYARLVPLGR